MSERKHEVTPFYPYPVVRNPHKFRCFDGEKWVDCDSTGKPLSKNSRS